MNLYEQKSAKEAELVALKDAIESGDDAAIKEGAEIAEALDAINASIQEAEKAQAALMSIGEDAPEEGSEPMENEAKTLGEFAVKSFGEMHRGGAINVTAPAFKAYSDVHTTTYVIDYDKNPVDVALYNPSIETLLASETISGNVLAYYIMGATEGTLGVTAENNEKPQIHVPYTPASANLEKIAAYLKETDELVEDAPWLKSAIDNRLVVDLQRAIRTYLTTELIATSGLGSATWAFGGTAADIADAVLNEAMTIEQTTGRKCNGVVMGPDIYATLRLGKDGDSRYYGGGYWGEQSVATLWGMPVVVDSTATAAVIVGDFSTASKVTNTNGVQVSMTNANEDDFIYNRITVRAEQRLALAVRMPSAFTILTEDASS